MHDKLVSQGTSADEAAKQLAQDTGRPLQKVRIALEGREKWKQTCEAAGYSAKGLLPSEAHLPDYLRKRGRCGDGRKHGPMRASGAGRKSTISFLFPAVKFWFGEMRDEGQYIDKQDLVDEFKNVAEAFLNKITVKSE